MNILIAVTIQIRYGYRQAISIGFPKSHFFADIRKGIVSIISIQTNFVGRIAIFPSFQYIENR